MWLGGGRDLGAHSKYPLAVLIKDGQGWGFLAFPVEKTNRVHESGNT